MNERIKEFLTPKLKEWGGASGDNFSEELEKFAELIVGECLDIVANADMTELEGPDPEDVLYVACKQIKQYFGVE
jgi:hypothetical protein